MVRGKRVRKRTSDGNLVYVGNFDSKGLNVNRNHPDIPNEIIGVCPSRKSHHAKALLKKRAFVCYTREYMARFFKREEKRPFNYPAIEEYKGGRKYTFWLVGVIILVFVIIYFVFK